MNRIFENVADENLSAFRETTPYHEFGGPEKVVENDVKDRGKGKEEKIL